MLLLLLFTIYGLRSHGRVKNWAPSRIHFFETKKASQMAGLVIRGLQGKGWPSKVKNEVNEKGAYKTKLKMKVMKPKNCLWPGPTDREPREL